MFTGIIEELGKISALTKHSSGAKIQISAKVVTENTNEGDSISVNGVCLTALEITPNGFAADVSQETLNRSTLGNLKVGAQSFPYVIFQDGRLGPGGIGQKGWQTDHQQVKTGSMHNGALKTGFIF